MNVLDRFRLDGKRLFITGGSRGFGRVIALAAAEAGADIVLNARDASALARTAEEVRERGRKVSTFAADIVDPAACEALCRQVLAEAGPIHILVNNVGGRDLDVAIEDTDVETWRHFIDLNLTHCFICTKMIGGAMLARGEGRIINIASISGLVANRGIGGRHYETTKAAVIHFTRAAAADWAPRGVTVNAICPGLFMTEPNLAWAKKNPDVIETFIRAVPMGRTGEPHEIGPLAVYLASPASSYVTGAAFVIDGGYTLW
ncbi:MAG TPA: SDR family NAD(P)-dependent oxidoreductase [Aestuariivirgaceae bacterium]|nr:SDR family NAD(P)-dependent oxidoreductase [Aestuariivirgaceae bacterium]